MPPRGFVNRIKWLANADDAGRDIETNGYLTFTNIWKTKTFNERANLEPWQEKKLVEIGFPLTKAENKRMKTASRKAIVDSNMSIMADGLEEKGIHLPFNQIKHACGAYNVERKLCQFEGGCTNIAVGRGLCDKHQGAVASAIDPHQYLAQDQSMLPIANWYQAAAVSRVIVSFRRSFRQVIDS